MQQEWIYLSLQKCLLKKSASKPGHTEILKLGLFSNKSSNLYPEAQAHKDGDITIDFIL
jgi:hypothetical protein